jgi:DNA methylase
MVDATNRILCGDNQLVLPKLAPECCDVVLTSPPYNINPRYTRRLYANNTHFTEGALSNGEYIQRVVSLFTRLERLVRARGVVLWNQSANADTPSLPYQTVAAVERGTRWRLIDTIFWNKQVARPMFTSPTLLTRVCETIFVFGRDDITSGSKPIPARLATHTNKQMTRLTSDKCQPVYACAGFSNLLTTRPPCRRGASTEQSCLRASFTTHLVTTLLDMYCPPGGTVLDPYMGSGTTAVGAVHTGRNFIGVEIEPAYVAYAAQRLAELTNVGDCTRASSADVAPATDDPHGESQGLAGQMGPPQSPAPEPPRCSH